jgi:hypothetical protein
MSNTSKLPYFAIQQLYKNSLVDIHTNKSNNPELKTENKDITNDLNVSYLGGFEKQIVIYTHTETDLFISEDLLTFLSKILAACQLSIADVAILNLYHHKNPFQMLKSLNAQRAILFVPEPSAWELEDNFSLYEPFHIRNIQCMLAHELQTIQQDAAKKLQLWNALKTFFNI